MNAFVVPVLVCSALCLIQFGAALPWLIALDPRAAKRLVANPVTWLVALGSVIGAGAVLALFVDFVQDPPRLIFWGRLFGAALHLQIAIDAFVFVFLFLMLVQPKMGAVALSAFREGVRQPLFWLILGVAVAALSIYPFVPFFTFGEDFKMFSELGFDTIMLAAVLFTVLAAAMSISEEIEGRTAITLMSKPVSRRQFLLGKFVGILLAGLLMTVILGLAFDGLLWFKAWFDKETIADPVWLEPARRIYAERLGESALNFMAGMGVWFDWIYTYTRGLIFGFSQVMVMLAIAVALATRLPMIVNLVSCLVVFFLGHLTHVLVQVSAVGKLRLVNFMARFFENVFPGLEYFDIGPVIVRDVAPDDLHFWYYTGSVVLYAVLYSVIALLFGLILFEDRDLA